jgi:ubiquinone/menaquinone biosynthesis C-methylase UbiE
VTSSQPLPDLVPPEELAAALTLASTQFDLAHLADTAVSLGTVRRYYRWNWLPYLMFQSRRGAIHLALDLDEDALDGGLVEQASIVGDHLSNAPGRRVLELGSGTGFNSVHLAGTHPGHSFEGVDSSALHLAMARWRARGSPHLRFRRLDFHRLPYPDGEFALVFAIEALCHAQVVAGVLDEVHRVLAPGGVFLVFDLFQSVPTRRMSAEWQFTVRLTARALQVLAFHHQASFVEMASAAGLEVCRVEDLSTAVLPNLVRLQKTARRYFTGRHLAPLARHLLPAVVRQNVVAGLLLPLSVRQHLHRYQMLILRKPRGGDA